MALKSVFFRPYYIRLVLKSKVNAIIGQDMLKLYYINIYFDNFIWWLAVLEKIKYYNT